MSAAEDDERGGDSADGATVGVDHSGDSERSEVESWLQAAARTHNTLPLPVAGQVIADKYRIEEALGQGGMGAVFRATHVVSDKAVAIKWMLRPASD